MVALKRILASLAVIALLASSVPFFTVTGPVLAEDSEYEKGTLDEITTSQVEFILESPIDNSPAAPVDEPIKLQSGWNNIMTDGFEGEFPGSWIVNSESGTDAYWGKDSHYYHTGSHSAFCAKNGSAGVNPPASYPNNMEAWMVYGPFSLADATDAELNFWLWLESEPTYDRLMCLASIDGMNFYGSSWSGNTDWNYESFDLTNVFTLGNLCGHSQVWIAFVFVSDISITYQGAFIDDVVLRKDTTLEELAMGDRVQTTTNLNVRKGPGLVYDPPITNEPTGSTGTIVCSTPQSADGYTWWVVSYDDGIRGWSVQDGLMKIGSIPTLVNLDVPYIHQCYDTPDNFDGRSACGPASAVMALAYWNKVDPWPDTCSWPEPHTSDYGNYISREYTYDSYTFSTTTLDPSGNPSAGAYGHMVDDPNVGAVLNKLVDYLNIHNCNSEGIMNPSESQVKAELDSGYVVLASTELTEDGHWVLIKGYTQDGYYVVHDPNGCAANDPGEAPYYGYNGDPVWGLHFNYSGDNVLYKWDEMKIDQKWIATAHPAPSQPAAWTFMVYADGDNNLEQCELTNFNFMETEADNEDVNVIVQIDRIPGFDSSNDDWTTTRRYEVKHDTDLDNLASYTLGVDYWDMGELNMADPATLSDFVLWAKTNYPAYHYCLVISNHGSGWQPMIGGEAVPMDGWEPVPKGIVWDDTSGDYMSIADMGIALDTATSGGTEMLDVLFLDACLMQMIEVGYEIKDYSQYLVASEYYGWGPGPYQDYVAYFTSTTTAEGLATAIVNIYHNWFASTDAAHTMSNADLSQFGLASVVDDFAQALTFELATYSTEIGDARSACQKFVNDSYIDLYHFAFLIDQNIADTAIQNAAQAVMTAVNNAIITEAHANGDGVNYYSLDNAHGISIYFPASDSDIGYSNYNDTNLAFVADKGWDEFLAAFLGGVITPPPPPDLVSPPNAATNVSLTPTFEWNNAPGADEHGLYISEPPYGPENLVFDSEVDYGILTGTSLTLPSGILNNDVTYYWNMRSHNSAGWGDFSTSWYFTTESAPNNPPNIPSSPSPTDDATGVSEDADLSWTGGDPDSVDTVTYDVYFGTSDNPPLVSEDQSATTYDPGTLIHDTHYYWRIDATDNHEMTTIGPLWDFTTATSSNTSPEVTNVTASQSSPIVNITYDVNDAEQSDVTISFEYWDGDSWEPCVTTTGDGTQSIGTGKSGTWDAKADFDEHYMTDCNIRVNVDDGQTTNNTGSGESSDFTLDTKDPTEYGCDTPVDTATDVSINSSLTCLTGSDDSPAISYYFQLAEDTAFSAGLQESGWQADTTWSSSTLNYSTQYYWRVMAKDGYDNETDYSTAFSFTTEAILNNPPDVPSSPSPADDAIDVSLDADLSWTGDDPDTGDTVTFDVYFGTSDNPPLVSDDQSATTYDPQTLSRDTLYYWRVDATDNHGATTDGPLWHFTTAANTPPTAPAVDVTPDLPLTDDNLVCTITTESFDTEGDPVTYTYEWYKDGVLQDTLTTDTVNSSLTAIGETWRCVVTPNDGSDDGPPTEDQTIIVEALVTQPVTDGTLNVTVEADTEVVVTGTATVTVAKYTGNPGSSFNGDIGKHIDVYINDASGVTEIEVRLYYTDAEISGKVESSLTLQWWNGTAWVLCSDTGVNTEPIGDYSGYIWARIRADTTPSLDNLTGTPFGGKGTMPPSPASGSGGGGGMVGVLAFAYIIDMDGRLKTEARAVSENAEAYLLLAQGTYCLLYGFPPSFIYIFPLSQRESPPIPEYAELMTRIFIFGPEDCTFDPAIKLIFNYDPTKIPEGFSAQDIYIATWNEESKQWIRLESNVNLESKTIMTEISGFSIYTVMVSPQLADISVTGLIITPEVIYEGDDATVTASLVNSGDFTGTYEAILRINDTIEETRIVDIAGNDSVTISFELTGLDYGSYQITIGEATGTLIILEVIEPTPAAFTTSSLEISPEEVDIGEDANISVWVDNTGETEGTCQLVCKANGVILDEKEITLAGGSGEAVVFTTTFGEAGEKLIEVNEMSGSLIVKEVVEGEPSPEPGSVAEEAEIPIDEIIEEPEPESRWWIVGLILGVCAVIIVSVIFFNMRRRSVS